MAFNLIKIELMNALKNAIHSTLFLTFFLSSTQAGISSSTKASRDEHLAMRAKILSTFKKKLPKKFSHYAYSVTHTVMEQSSKHNIDPLLITAVIAGESNFNPTAIGPIGEIGMMQLRASTAEWIAKKKGIHWRGVRALTNPNYNIRLGVAYLSYLKKRFSSRGGLLYLAAYNMGETSLQRLLSNKIQPKAYSEHVIKNYIAIN